MTYSAVSAFKNLNINGDVVTGIAYPSEGPFCSAIDLFSAGRLFGVVRAERYSGVADAQGIRWGWCQFWFMLQREYFLLDDILSLRCHVSGKDLAEIQHVKAMFKERVIVREQRECLVEDVLAGVMFVEDGNAKIDDYSSILRELFAKVPVEKYVVFLYRFILAREPDEGGFKACVLQLRLGADPVKVARNFAASEEFMATRKSQRLPTPFSADFGIIAAFSPSSSAGDF